MQFKVKTIFVSAMVLASSFTAGAQEEGKTTMLTLEDAIRIALSENVSIKVADMEIQRSEYAKKGTYASLLPQIDASGAYQRTIKKQVMYMDGGGFNFGDMIGEALVEYLMPLYAQHPGVMPPITQKPEEEEPASTSNEGISVGRWNTWSTGISASLPLVNFQLWQSIRISGMDVELAVEKARSSRLDMVAQVKQAFYAVLMAKESAKVYSDVLFNAEESFKQTEMRYKVQKASELEYTRAKSTVQNAVPNVYNAEASVLLALWQLKAVMGVDLDMDIDVVGSLEDYTSTMLSSVADQDYDLSNNTTMRQLALQAEELAASVKAQKAAYLPSLALSFSYNMNAMTNDFKFSEYKWTPYSFAGLSLQIPIFSGGRRLNQVRQAKVQQSEFLLQKDNTERQLKIAIRSYLTTMETSMKNYYAALSGVETAQKAYDIASKSYNVGRSTITELNDAQLALTQSRLGANSAIYNFMVAKSNLEQTLGADYTE